MNFGANNMADFFGIKSARSIEERWIAEIYEQRERISGKRFVPDGRGGRMEVVVGTPGCVADDVQAAMVTHPSLSILSHNDAEAERIAKYFGRTIADSHTQFARATVVAVQKCSAPSAGEETMMLWHGTDSANITSIISGGFRVGSSGMFGGGIYFADCASKSLQYCGNGISSNGSRYCHLLLCEVALGVMVPATHAQPHLRSAPYGGNSVMGVGSSAHDFCVEHNGVLWPSSLLYSRGHSQQLQFNEFIVYDSAAARVRFVVTVRL